MSSKLQDTVDMAPFGEIELNLFIYNGLIENQCWQPEVPPGFSPILVWQLAMRTGLRTQS